LAALGGAGIGLGLMIPQPPGMLCDTEWGCQLLPPPDPGPTASADPSLKPDSPNQPASPGDKAQKKSERADYHRICDAPPPPGLSKCDLLKWKLNQRKQCKTARQQFADKWYGGTMDSGHSDYMDNLDRSMAKLEEELGKCCK
jgi:hypothetical protein